MLLTRRAHVRQAKWLSYLPHVFAIPPTVLASTAAAVRMIPTTGHDAGESI